MKIIPGICPHCGSGFMESGKDYLWHCRKCGRYEAKPFEDTKQPATSGRQIEIKMETRTCQTLGCEKTFEVRPGTKRVLCTACQAIRDAKEYRNKIRREREEETKKKMARRKIAIKPCLG